jgi:GDPmannose 4,6-dehydratase
VPSRKALITGIMGQDGSYLADSLLQDGYLVYGAHRGPSNQPNWRLENLKIADHPNLNLFATDITDPNAMRKAITEIRPDEVYNLASHSFVADSNMNPYQTSVVTGLGVVNILQAISEISPETRFFQAGSSEMFGNCLTYPQNEESPFSPRNIYGSAKVFAHMVSVNFREIANLFSSSGILFNHESPLRGHEFVTRKITRSVAKINLGQAEVLKLGNLSSIRDWGYAPEYVYAMRLILGHDKPETFVISSGVMTTVREFVEASFNALDKDIIFEGEGLGEIGVDAQDGKVLVRVDEEFFREAEAIPLVGDSTKAKNVLGWNSQTKVSEIARLMVEQDLRNLRIDGDF